MKTLLKNARILKMDDTPIFFGSIVVIDNKIAYIGDDYKKFEPFDVVRECEGNVLMPGFKNAHTHNAMTFLRSKGDDVALQEWLFNIVFPREAQFEVEDIYHLCKVSYLECLTSGITACFDQYFYPLMNAKAAIEMGMRLNLVGTYNDTTTKENLFQLYDMYNTDPDGLIRYTYGIHAEYTLPDMEAELMKEVILTKKAPFYTHACESEKEVRECLERRGVTPIEFFDNLGYFTYGGGCYHCVHMSDHDIEIFKKHNLSVVTCPSSNSKLASGIAPIWKYVKEGINVAIGTDGPASNNSLDMFKEMTLVTFLQKVTCKDPEALPATEVLKMATVNGAKAMNLLDCDILEVNKKADIIEIDLSRPNMQPINDIVNNIVYAGSKDNIKMTMINGKILYADRKFYVNEDVEEIYKKTSEIRDKIEKKYLESLKKSA